ncbi:MAG TPA: hypothetical protein VEX35_15405 [Allosphingosinicella sp.]|nr:hypothetical protein [Allosphingosinicella sp.]
MRRLLLAAALLAAPAGPAVAGFPVTRQMTCPIGGERFDFTTTASYTTFGARPDGKPFGSWTFPLELPECPGNGLIVYQDTFEPAELTRLGALIETPAYRALRGGDTSYYRLSWLLREMGAPWEQVTWALIQATWQPADDSPLRARYLGELAAAAAAKADAPTDLPGYGLRAYGINALRELGRFEEAGALLSRTPLAPLRPGGGLPGAEERERSGWLEHFTKLEALLARRDRSADPAGFRQRE